MEKALVDPILTHRWASPFKSNYFTANLISSQCLLDCNETSRSHNIIRSADTDSMWHHAFLEADVCGKSYRWLKNRLWDCSSCQAVKYTRDSTAGVCIVLLQKPSNSPNQPSPLVSWLRSFWKRCARKLAFFCQTSDRSISLQAHSRVCRGLSASCQNRSIRVSHWRSPHEDGAHQEWGMGSKCCPLLWHCKALQRTCQGDERCTSAHKSCIAFLIALSSSPTDLCTHLPK